MKKKIKQTLKKLAIWLLDKTDKAELKSAKFDYKTEIVWSKYLAKKDKWYHLGSTMELFMKRSDKNTRTISEIAVFVDGVERGKWLI